MGNNINQKVKKDDTKIKKEKIEYKEKNRYKYNILFIGESGIGTKTSLIKRIIEGKFNEIKEDYKEKCENLIFEKDDKEIIFYLIDTSGDKEKRDLSKIYYKYADCIIMGYDVTNKNSFQEIIDYWYEQIKQLCNTNLIYLLGNKIDLNEEIKEREKEGK